MSQADGSNALDVTVVGAGIFGLWQAFEMARRGHRVVLCESMPEAESGGASRFAGAMLAPYCEEEGAEALVRREVGDQRSEVGRRLALARREGGGRISEVSRSVSESSRCGEE